MEIEYLNKLKDNPIRYGITQEFKIEGISLNEIQLLEQNWNNGNPFPKVLKELLYLAGNYCYVCDYGVNNNQQEIQEWIRENMSHNVKIISRPFYVFDVYGGDTFLFIFLDEGDNPQIYEANSWNPSDNWFEKVKNQTIQSLIDNRIERGKRGENPF